MARTTKRSGFKLRSGNSTPFKELGAAPIKPGSSKEELVELAKDFVTPVENIELDYGGSFDTGIEGSAPEPKKGEAPPRLPKVKDVNDKQKPKTKINWRFWQRKPPSGSGKKEKVIVEPPIFGGYDYGDKKK